MPIRPCLFCLKKNYSNLRVFTFDKYKRWGITSDVEIHEFITEEENDEAVQNQHELRFVCRRCRRDKTSYEDMYVVEDKVTHVKLRVQIWAQT
ncbi:hypothetical protein DPMN_052953 [Dreissena polymorpha]|uniref:Uncharacterized protein n=1 Tax=Dreissena polymorpha TaxID=45954 RepID=A0A9D4CMC8_DREPO|nr:hypothetical protein DPMN_052953 [Dreissena polymorpha]